MKGCVMFRKSSRVATIVLSDLYGSAANEAASWGNDSNYYGCLYDNTGGTKPLATITPRSSSSLDVWTRDRAQSWKLNGTGC